MRTFSPTYFIMNGELCLEDFDDYEYFQEEHQELPVEKENLSNNTESADTKIEEGI